MVTPKISASNAWNVTLLGKRFFTDVTKFKLRISGRADDPILPKWALNAIPWIHWNRGDIIRWRRLFRQRQRLECSN